MYNEDQNGRERINSETEEEKKWTWRQPSGPDIWTFLP